MFSIHLIKLLSESITECRRLSSIQLISASVFKSLYLNEYFLFCIRDLPVNPVNAPEIGLISQI